MSDISNVIEAIAYASANSSGKEHEFLKNMKNYLMTQDRYYEKKAKKLYKSLGYSSKARVDQFYNVLSDLYG